MFEYEIIQHIHYTLSIIKIIGVAKIHVIVYEQYNYMY